MTNKQMEEKIRQAFTNATPNHADSLAAEMLLSPTKNRKGAEKPMKPVRTSIQFRAIATLAATIAVVALIGGVLFLRNPDSNPTAQPGGSTGSSTTSTMLSLEMAIETFKQHLHSRADAPPFTNDFDLEYQLVGDTSNYELVYEFEIDCEPYDFIAHVYPDGEVLSWYEDDDNKSQTHGRFVGIDAALEAANNYKLFSSNSYFISLPEITRDIVDWDLDLVNGKYVYEIEVYNTADEVIFFVAAETGVVLRVEINEEHPPETTQGTLHNTEGPPISTQGPTISTEGPSGTNASTKLTEEQAWFIAYRDIGFPETSQLHTYTIQLEEDDGEYYYDVIIYADKLYEYEIRASDGKILEKDSEILYGGNSSNPPIIPIETALNFLFKNIKYIPDDVTGDSKIVKEDVTDLEWEIEADDENPHYDISFEYHGVEYGCKVGLYNLDLFYAFKPID